MNTTPSSADRPADSPSPEAQAGSPRTVETHDSTALPYLTVEQLARMLGLSNRGARLVLERGELPGFRLGRRWYVRRDELDRAIDRKVAEGRQDREAAARALRGLPVKKAPRKP